MSLEVSRRTSRQPQPVAQSFASQKLCGSSLYSPRETPDRQESEMTGPSGPISLRRAGLTPVGFVEAAEVDIVVEHAQRNDGEGLRTTAFPLSFTKRLTLNLDSRIDKTDPPKMSFRSVSRRRGISLCLFSLPVVRSCRERVEQAQSGISRCARNDSEWHKPVFQGLRVFSPVAPKCRRSRRPRPGGKPRPYTGR